MNKTIKLFHWTHDRSELKEHGFFGDVWFTDELVGDPYSVKPEMRMVTTEVAEEHISMYENLNKGFGYRSFSIPAKVASRFKLPKKKSWVLSGQLL